LDALRQRVETLEARLALLENQLHPAPLPPPAKGSTCQC
jgi:BMFP domain-containing protein YqiC